MNSAVELHDSEVNEIRLSGRGLHLTFPNAYVHKSNARPGIDAGDGYLQPVEMIFSEAQYTESNGLCSGVISEGTVSIGDEKFENMIPLPFDAKGNVSASISYASGGVLTIMASALSCTASGEARFVETFDE